MYGAYFGGAFGHPRQRKNMINGITKHISDISIREFAIRQITVRLKRQIIKSILRIDITGRLKIGAVQKVAASRKRSFISR